MHEDRTSVHDPAAWHRQRAAELIPQPLDNLGMRSPRVVRIVDRYRIAFALVTALVSRLEIREQPTIRRMGEVDHDCSSTRHRNDALAPLHRTADLVADAETWRPDLRYQHVGLLKPV